MLSPTFPQSSGSQSSVPQNPLVPKILVSRDQYRSCHICLPGDDQRTAAIVVDGAVYGLVKVVKSRKQALEICDRLAAKGSQTVITTIAKGEAIWRIEPDAAIAAPSHNPNLIPAKPATDAPACRILGSSNQYQSCHIYVPDLEQRLEAIIFNGSYYALFKVVDNRQQALEIAAKLSRRGDTPIITPKEQGDAVWVLEPEALLAV